MRYVMYLYALCIFARSWVMYLYPFIYRCVYISVMYMYPFMYLCTLWSYSFMYNYLLCIFTRYVSSSDMHHYVSLSVMSHHLYISSSFMYLHLLCIFIFMYLHPLCIYISYVSSFSSLVSPCRWLASFALVFSSCISLLDRI